MLRVVFGLFVEVLHFGTHQHDADTQVFDDFGKGMFIFVGVLQFKAAGARDFGYVTDKFRYFTGQ